MLSGNTCFWQVRYEDDGQTMVCHKYAARENDSVAATDQRHLLTSIWSDDAAALVATMEYLYALGHRRIARVGGLPQLLHTEIRTEAFAAMKSFPLYEERARFSVTCRRPLPPRSPAWRSV